MWGFELALMSVMVAVNGVFAAYEIALASVSRAQLQRRADEHRRGSVAALQMKDNMEASLAVVQLGITLVGATAAAVGGAGAEESVAPLLAGRLGVSENTAEVLAIALVVAPLTVVTIIAGELIPKVFALRNIERVCLVLSPLMRWFMSAAWPLVRFFEAAVKGVLALADVRAAGPGAGGDEATGLQQLRTSASFARASRLIGLREERIILGAAEMQTREIGTVMLPAEFMAVLDANASLSDNLITAHLEMHTRFPVVERTGDPQSVVGYATFKDIVAAMRANPGAPSFRSLIREIPSFGEHDRIAACLERMMRNHTHIALVRGAGGRIAGMVTLEDIFEELVGEIEDEFDRLPGHLVAAGPAWIVGGGLALERLRAATGVALAGDAPTAGVTTVSDWVVAALPRGPRGGDMIEREGLRVVVRKVRRGKVQEAQVGR